MPPLGHPELNVSAVQMTNKLITSSADIENLRDQQLVVSGGSVTRRHMAAVCRMTGGEEKEEDKGRAED